MKSLKKQNCSPEKNTAYHEAAHLVLGCFNFFGEPSYTPTSISIEEINGDSYGKVKGLTYYTDKKIDEHSTRIDYPSSKSIEQDIDECNKLWKEAIKDIAGITAEHFFCGIAKPNFYYDDTVRWQTDLQKYHDIISILHNLESLDYAEKREEKKLSCEKLWDKVVNFLENSKQVQYAIHYLQEKLIKQKTFEGNALEILLEEIEELLKNLNKIEYMTPSINKSTTISPNITIKLRWKKQQHIMTSFYKKRQKNKFFKLKESFSQLQNTFFEKIGTGYRTIKNKKIKFLILKSSIGKYYELEELKFDILFEEMK